MLFYKLCLKLLDLFPEHPHANYDLGYIYREKKEYSNAAIQYSRALKIDQDNVYVHYDLGFIYKENGAYQEALSEYTKVLEIDPAHKYALWDIGVVYEELGMKDKAEEQLKLYHEMTDCSFRRFWNCLD